MIDDIKFQSDVSPISEYSRDTTEIFVAHDHSWNRSIDVEGAVVEGAYLTKLTSGIIDADERAIFPEKVIKLFCNLGIGQRLGSVWIRSRSW